MSVARCFIGIGAARSGTTWLSRQLASHPEIAMSPIKELHYWDIKAGLATLDSLRFLQNRDDKWANRRRKMKSDADYFEYLHSVGEKFHGIPCEFTPAYMRCPESYFSTIQATALDVKFILLMREPSRRLISQCQSRFRRGRKVDWSIWKNDKQLSRSDYQGTLEKLDNSGVQFVALIYERMIAGGDQTQDELKRLSDFLEIKEFGAANLERGANTKIAISPPSDLPGKVWKYMQPQREAVYAIRPDVRAMWEKLAPSDVQ